MKHYLIFTILLLLSLQSCQDDNTPVNQLEFYWDQTSCADPWSTGSNGSNEATRQAVENYLEQEDVHGAVVTSITSNGVQVVCSACSCTTGKRINVEVPLNQKSKMLTLGFQESS